VIPPELWAVLSGIAAGAVSGALAAVLGYSKSVTVEKFEGRKAVQTLVIGGIVGGYAGYMGIPYAKAEEYLLTVGGIVLIEYVKKAVWRAWKRWREGRSGPT